MHEVSLVAALVEECERQAGGQPVAMVRVSHSSTLPEETLRQAFEMLTSDGLLTGAQLETEQVEERLECECGFNGPLGHDDVMGPVVACPQCGEVHPRKHITELALVEVRLGQSMARG